MSRADLKPCDIVFVIAIAMFEGERRTPAEIVSIEPQKIGARFLSGDHRGGMIALEIAAENRTWRRA
ncbi:hypothetical protein [Paraburkholderia tuberum]|uniref:hypothetical protein n=1 Tax=Paraburkholderia TaxID=1822464 RepID=UPI00035D6507|nr:hypothetical protein [Paraburkholderia tuberum]